MKKLGLADALTVRKATPEDARGYAACHNACWQEVYTGMVPTAFLEKMAAAQETYTAHYAERLSHPGDCDYYLVLSGTQVSGFVIINRGEVAESPGAREIWAIYLREAFWGQGHGRLLLDFAVAQLRPLATQTIFLWVFEENHRARRFYEKNGFLFDGTVREADYGGPVRQLRYTYTL